MCKVPLHCSDSDIDGSQCAPVLPKSGTCLGILHVMSVDQLSLLPTCGSRQLAVWHATASCLSACDVSTTTRHSQCLSLVRLSPPIQKHYMLTILWLSISPKLTKFLYDAELFYISNAILQSVVECQYNEWRWLPQKFLSASENKCQTDHIHQYVYQSWKFGKDRSSYILR